MTTHITQRTIADGLHNLGLNSGDVVILHSSLASLGKVSGGADAVVDAFLDVIGPEGTLVVPTFGALGVITDVVKDRPESISSIHPKASVAAIGSQAKAICADHWKQNIAHAEGTPYVRIADLDGYVCLLGVDQDRNTTLHTVEELLRLPYLTPTAETTFETPEGMVTKSWSYFPGPHRDFIGLDRALRESGKMCTATIGSAVARLVRSRDLIDIGKELGKSDPAFCLCDSPACADCVRQRAELTRARFGRESFTLAASTMLAGRYAEEIADNCHAAGLDCVELDGLTGNPLSRVQSNRLHRAVAALTEEGISICGLRLRSTGAAAIRLLDTAKELGISRVVLPLTGDVRSLATSAVEKGIDLSFANVAADAATVSRTLAALCSDGIPANLTLNPGEFVLAGENPFLRSYRQRLRRFIDQVDIEDVTFAGETRFLGQGNAEIKELVSILRCHSFGGRFILTPHNRIYPHLTGTVNAFRLLLDSI